jgi:CIC family chloride channel protein
LLEARTKDGTSEPEAAPSFLESFRSRALGWFASLQESEAHLSLFLSLLIGALVGLVVVAFILLTGRVASRMYPAGSEAWRRVLVPAIGSLIAGYFLYFYFPQARGSGIPQIKAALSLADGVIRLRTVVGKFFCCTLSLASGIALGREGPSVQIGGGLASVVARRLGLSRSQVKGMVPAGCAAALAAAFNTPIAAVLFSLEEVLGDLHAPVLGSVVLSSATSWMVLHLFLGDNPLFHVPAYQLVNPAEFAIYAFLGVVGGLTSVAFVKLLLNLRLWFRKLPQSTAWMQPAAGGLAVGIMGWFVPGVLGVGYDYLERVLNGDVVLGAVVLLLLLKIPATAVCYSSGNAGGIFGPSLFIGGMLGASVGSIAHLWWPAVTADPGAYALIGMGAAFAGIIRTPLTSVIMIFELTRDYTIIVPVMISNLIAFFISQRLQPEPIYEALSLQDGVHLPRPEHRIPRGQLRVGDIMRPSGELPSTTDTVSEALRIAHEANLDLVPVREGANLVGVLSTAELERARDQADRELASLLPGPEATPAEFPHLHADQDLSVALDRLSAAHSRTLPVVSRQDVRKIVGILRIQDFALSIEAGTAASSAGEQEGD